LSLWRTLRSVSDRTIVARSDTAGIAGKSRMRLAMSEREFVLCRQQSRRFVFFTVPVGDSTFDETGGDFDGMLVARVSPANPAIQEVQMADIKGIRNIEEAAEEIQNATAAGRHAIEEGYEAVRDYGEKSLEYAGQLGQGLTDFVRRQPFLAVGAAFLVGYLTAQILRRIPS